MRLSICRDPAGVIVTIGAWVYTVHSARSMSSAMPMPGGWSMSMAWMSMGNQSRARARRDVSRDVDGDDDGHDAAVGDAGRAPASAGFMASRVEPRRRGQRARSGCSSPDIFRCGCCSARVAYVDRHDALIGGHAIDTTSACSCPRRRAWRSERPASYQLTELEAALPAPLPLAAGVFFPPPDSPARTTRGDSACITARIARRAAGD